MTTVAEILDRIRAVFAKGQMNPAVMAGVTADLTEAVEELNDGLGANVATQAEVDAGVNAVKSVAPSTLAAAKTVSQPPSITDADAHTFAAVDIGAVIHATGAGAMAYSLPDLSAALQTARELILTVQCTGAASAVTITPGAASQIDGAGVGVAYVAAVGRTRISLVSNDGLNWYSGA